MPISCKGDAYKVSEKVKINSNIIQQKKPLRLIQESSLTSQCSNEQNENSASERVFITDSLTENQAQFLSTDDDFIEELFKFCDGDGDFLPEFRQP